MMRVDILVPDTRKEKVVRDLEDSGLMELIEADAPGVEKSGISDSYPRVSEFINMIEDTLEAFPAPVKKDNIGSKEKVSVRDDGTERLLLDAEKMRPILENVRSIRDELKSCSDRKEKLSAIGKIVSLLGSLDVDPSSVSGHDLVSVFLGNIPAKDVLKVKEELSNKSRKSFVKAGKASGGSSLLVAVVSNEHADDSTRILNTSGFEPLKLPEEISGMSLAEAKSFVEGETEKATKLEDKLKNELLKLSEKRHDLLVLLELLKIEKNLDESGMKFGKTNLTGLISGWVPEAKLKSLESTVKRSSNNACEVSSRKPGKGEIPPSLMHNPGPASGFEMITKNYGLPAYDELDPTKIITFTFPFIFGMMFGDVGHGIMLFIAGLFMVKKFDAGIRDFGKTIVICGIAATFFGFLYGSMFGLTIENTSWMFHPLWMEPLAHGGANITYFIKFSIMLALVVLSLGCILNIVNKARHSLIHAFFHPWGVLGLWVLLAGANLFFRHGMDFIPLIITGVLGNAEAMSTIFTDFMLLLIPVALVPVGEIFVDKKPVPVGLYAAMEVLQCFLVNTISYVRVVIIAVVHGALLLMVMKVMEVVTSGMSGPVGSVVSVLIFIIGNVGVFGMEAMISMVQTVRLHYYELFSKFYSASGRRFSPFKTERNYTVRK